MASSATSVQLVAVDATRVFASVFNQSTAVMTVLMAPQGDNGALLTAGRKTVDVAAGGYFETPVDFCGEIWAKWASANGTAEITEYR